MRYRETHLNKKGSNTCLRMIRIFNCNGDRRNINVNKIQLRRQMRRVRRDLEPHKRQQAELLIKEHFIKSQLTASSVHIACYHHFDGEVSLEPIIDWLLLQQKQVYAPVIEKNENNAMQFFPISVQEQITHNKYGIREPDARQLKPILPQDLDIIMLPLVAADQKGHRLALGKGYYDKYLTQCQDNKRLKKIGVAYHCQLIEKIENDTWDICLDYLITEKGIQEYNHNLLI